jgi:peptidoglycan/xylan/chitin deacetylase (PgdA/CDA1 family)
MTAGGASRGANGRCVLVVHRVMPVVERDHDVRRADFEALLDRLVAAGTRFAADLDAVPTDGSVILTFDDASTDHLETARALANRGIVGVFFPTVGVMGTPGHLDAAGLQELVACGHVLGSHGWSHKRLDRLTSAELEDEVVTSRKVLEDTLGISVRHFAPAGGIGFKGMAGRLGAAGYVVSRSTRWGIYRSLGDRWAIPTVPVTQMTIGRGWVDGAATRIRLPFSFAAVGIARSAMGSDTRTRLRQTVMRRRHAAVPESEDPPDQLA